MILVPITHYDSLKIGCFSKTAVYAPLTTLHTGADPCSKEDQNQGWIKKGGTNPSRSRGSGMGYLILNPRLQDF